MNLLSAYIEWQCTAGSLKYDSSLIPLWITKLNVKHYVVEVKVTVFVHRQVFCYHAYVSFKLCRNNLQYAVVILSIWLKVNAFTIFLSLIVKTYIVALTNARNFNLCHKIVVCNMFVISTI